MTVRQIGEIAVHSPLKRALLLVIAVLFFLSGTAFAVPPVMYNVTIYDGSSVTEVTTAETDANKILENAGIKIDASKEDEIDLCKFTKLDGSEIVINRGVKVSLNSFDGTEKTVYANGTVKDAIEKAEMTVPSGSATNYSMDTKLKKNMVIEIYGVYNVTVKCDGAELTFIVSGKTVNDVINTLQIELNGDDFTEPGLDAELSEGMVIEVLRVTYAERSETEAIDYETEYTYSDSLNKGRTKVLEKGIKGEKVVVYRDRYINGQLADTTIASENVTKEPVRELVQSGTKVYNKPTSIPVGKPISELKAPASLTIGADGAPKNYKSIINAQATAYCIPGGITSTGKVAQAGYIAVDPKEIPYGTQMYIVSADGNYVYGYCIAADTGSYIYDVDWTGDLFMNSNEQCVNWGRRDIIIYVL